jgi:ketosteroid isomerase-like protein
MVPHETNTQARNRQVPFDPGCARRSTIIRCVSAENVALVREVMALMNASVTDGEAMRKLYDLIDPDVRIDMSRRVFNPDVYEGHDGVRRLGRDVADVWDEFRLEPERFVDAGDKVVVIEKRSGRGKGSGVVVEQRSAVIWTLRGGKVLALETEFAPAEALRAAGVAE